jgi:hypothetical protein
MTQEHTINIVAHSQHNTTHHIWHMPNMLKRSINIVMTPIYIPLCLARQTKQDKKQVQHNRNNYNSTAEITKQNSRTNTWNSRNYLEQQWDNKNNRNKYNSARSQQK